jgi:hypothetical protein
MTQLSADLTWQGSFTPLDLIAASTNSLTGALLARRPDRKSVRKLHDLGLVVETRPSEVAPS